MYYQIAIRKVTFAEMWRASSNLFVFVILALMKLCFVRNRPTFGFTWEDRLPQVPPTQLPPRVWNTMESLVLDAHQHGFGQGLFFRLSTIGSAEFYGAILRDHDGVCLLNVNYERVWQNNFEQVKCGFRFLTKLSNGEWVFTSGQTREDNLPPQMHWEYLPGQSLTAVRQRHLERLSQVSSAPLLIRDDAALEGLFAEYKVTQYQFNIHRGVYQPLPESEVVRLQAQSPSISPAPSVSPASANHGAEEANENVVMAQLADGAAVTSAASVAPEPFAGVLAELEQLQHQRSSWGGLVTLGVSLAAFAGIGAAQWDGKFLAMLIPILFFHELGHYLTMRLFRYRNLQMFFVPLFGAAVTGRHYNVPGWKKAIVSLAGPTPGIAVAVVLGIVGIFTERPLLIEGAVTCLVLNGMNLLPILPLDGGWAMHALLFSRHVIWDIVFRAIAAATLIGGGFMLGGFVLPIMGVVMLISLPTVYRLARLATDLRQGGLAPDAGDGDSIPRETAKVIAAQVTTAFPKLLNDRQRAEHVVKVFENLNSRPPGWLATLALLGVYGASLLAVVVGGIVFAIAKHGDLGDFLNAASRRPTRQLNPSLVRHSRPQNGDVAPDTEATLIATLRSLSDAERCYADLVPKLVPPQRATLFGQSVLLQIPNDPAERERWRPVMSGWRGKMAEHDAKRRVVLRMAAIAPNEQVAEEIETALRFCSQSMQFDHPIAPWQPDMELTPEMQRARRTLGELTSFSPFAGVHGKERMRKLQEAIAAGKPEKILEIEEKIHDEAFREFAAELRKRDDIDRELVDEYERHQRLSRDEEHPQEVDELRKAISLRLGQLPLRNGEPSPADVRLGARSMLVHRTGLMLRIEWASFVSPADGWPVFAKWLARKNCLDIHYEVLNVSADDEFDDDDE